MNAYLCTCECSINTLEKRRHLVIRSFPNQVTNRGAAACRLCTAADHPAVETGLVGMRFVRTASIRPSAADVANALCPVRSVGTSVASWPGLRVHRHAWKLSSGAVGITVTGRGWVRFRSARRSPGRRPPRYRGSTPWTQAWSDPGAAAPRAGSLFAHRSASPLSGGMAPVPDPWRSHTVNRD